jgi:pilus assembly protein CpaC
MYFNGRAIGAVTIVASLMTLLFAGPAAAQGDSDQNRPAFVANELEVPLFKSRVVRLDRPAARISVGNPDIADILILRSSQLYVLGKDLGTTNVLLWDRNEQLIDTVAVEVAHDLGSLKHKLHQLMPSETIEVFSVQRSIALRGLVTSVANMETALRVAEGYLAQVQTGTDSAQFEQDDQSQVMLEVKVAEIARTELKRLDAQFNAFHSGGKVSWGGVNGGATFPDVVFPEVTLPNGSGGTFTIPEGRRPVFDGVAPWGPAIDEFAPTDMVIEDKGLFMSYLGSEFLFNLALDAAKEKGLAKILAEPTLTTLSGQEAKFLSGGEFPIPVPQGNNGAVTVEFKEFGVGLRFLPMVLGGDSINVKLNVTVSDLANSNTIAVGADNTTSTFIVPSLTKRSANAVVELRDGQTIGIAGLINDNVREVVTKFPGLGELPVIGALFRSQEFQNNESELVIMVTPRLAKPITPEDMRLPTDKFVEPNDVDFYLLGRTEGKAPEASSTDPEAGGTEANYGHRVN